MDPSVRLMYPSVSDIRDRVGAPSPSPRSSQIHTGSTVHTTQPDLWLPRWDWYIYAYMTTRSLSKFFKERYFGPHNPSQGLFLSLRFPRCRYTSTLFLIISRISFVCPRDPGLTSVPNARGIPFYVLHHPRMEKVSREFYNSVLQQSTSERKLWKNCRFIFPNFIDD